MWRQIIRAILAATLFTWAGSTLAEITKEKLAGAEKDVEQKVIAWRRDFHKHPELSNREVRTAGVVASHLKAMGFEVKTGIAHTGVVGVLRGGKAGPVVALRADMDALPVTEELNLEFSSKVVAEYRGKSVGVMHACGHDAHIAILLGVAEVLSRLKSEIPGTIKLIFQPAEEGAPPGEEGGAALMIREGVLTNPKPDVIFGLHVWTLPPGTIGYRSEGFMAGSHRFEITVLGEQTHGATPWRGKDPITVAAQIITALQMIPSRQLDITQSPALISVGKIEGGDRFNIIPDKVKLEGTIRIFDKNIQENLFNRIHQTTQNIAESAGLSSVVKIMDGIPVTYNDPALVTRMLPTLQRVGSEVKIISPVMGAEDFSLYQQEIPGFYFFLGINEPGVDPGKVAMNHSPRFYINEDALMSGVKALSMLAIDFLSSQTQP